MQTVSGPLISEDLIEKFRQARDVLVLTGAGVSAESGVPTFRGGGDSTVWKGMPVDVVASADMMRRDLAAVWEWFDSRRNLLGELQPNPAHFEIARWQIKFAKCTVVTQNVDGLHQSAGAREVIELHGSIWRARCRSCHTRYAISKDGLREELCESCGDLLRPDVVLFGEVLPSGAFEFAAATALECELCFIVGTSGLVYPAAGLAEIAKAGGAYVVEINPERTPLSPLCDEVLTGKAGEILPMFAKL